MLPLRWIGLFCRVVGIQDQCTINWFRTTTWCQTWISGNEACISWEIMKIAAIPAQWICYTRIFTGSVFSSIASIPRGDRIVQFRGCFIFTFKQRIHAHRISSLVLSMLLTFSGQGWAHFQLETDLHPKTFTATVTNWKAFHPTPISWICTK